MRRAQHDFFSRSKRVLLETAILILFAASLLDFLWYKLNPIVSKIIDWLGAG